MNKINPIDASVITINLLNIIYIYSSILNLPRVIIITYKLTL